MAWPAGELRGRFEVEDRTVFNENYGQSTSLDLAIEGPAGPAVYLESKPVEPGWGGCSVYAQGDCDVRHRETLAVALPRGSGKTTLCLSAVLWAILSGQHEFVCLIASAQEARPGDAGQPQELPPATSGCWRTTPRRSTPSAAWRARESRCTGQRYYGVPTRIGWGVDELVMPTIPGSGFRLDGCSGRRDNCTRSQGTRVPAGVLDELPLRWLDRIR